MTRPLRRLFLNCGSYQELDGAGGERSRPPETAQTSMTRAYFGNDIWGRALRKGLMLFRCLCEALYPGFAADGTLTALHNFYEDCSFRQKLISRAFKKTLFDR